MADIFICYRRDDTQTFAGRIFDRLTRHFGDAAAFLDVEGRKGGEFLKRLEQEANPCKVMVVLIGKQWLTLSDKGGVRRLDKPDDVVRQECRIGLGNGALMIPVTVDGAPVPAKDDLPNDIARLADFDAVEIRHTRFNDDVEELLEIVEQKVSRAGQGRKSTEGSSSKPGPAAPSLATTLPGSWQVHIVYLNGVIGTSVVHFAPQGTFQAEGHTPFLRFRIGGTWQATGPSQLALAGQQSDGFQTMPYMATVFFSQVSQQNLTATFSSGEQTTWQRLS